MKLGNYYQKSIPVKQKRDQSIIVTNDRIKKEFTKQLKNKETQIFELTKQIEKSQQKIVQDSNLYKDIQERHLEALETIRNNEERDAENFRLKMEVGQLRPQVEQVAPLKHQLEQTKEELVTLQTERSKYLRDIELGKDEIDQNKKTIEKLKSEAVGATFTISTYEGDYTAALKELEELQHESDLLTKQTTEQSQDIHLLSTNFFYWKDAAQSFQEQLQKEATLRDEIQQTLDILTRENTLEEKKVTKSSQAYKEAKTIILELNNRNLELTKFTDEMSKIIVEQKKKMVSLGQLSQAAIGSKENFHIPFARENLRTKQLGNAKPTLLKFKETDNDNN